MSKALRVAPSAGYDTLPKAEYREEVWRRFRSSARTGLRFCRALIMPSIEGTEIDVAERYGCRRENIIAVDNNVAIAATLSRRYRGITAWGCDVFDALERAHRRGIRLDLVHLDLTSNLSPSAFASLRSVSRGGIPEGCIIVINSLKGREPREWLENWRSSERDEILGANSAVTRLMMKRLVKRSARDRAKQLNRVEERTFRTALRRELVGKDDDLLIGVEELKEAIRSGSMMKISGKTVAELPHASRRSIGIAAATGWRPIGWPKTYTSGRAPMVWSAWRA